MAAAAPVPVHACAQSHACCHDHMPAGAPAALTSDVPTPNPCTACHSLCPDAELPNHPLAPLPSPLRCHWTNKQINSKWHFTVITHNSSVTCTCHRGGEVLLNSWVLLPLLLLQPTLSGTVFMCSIKLSHTTQCHACIPPTYVSFNHIHHLVHSPSAVANLCLSSH